MNKVLMSLLFVAFVLTGSGFAQTPPPSPVVVVHRDHHPEIHKAMRKLRAAKEDLQKAASDYGGHKARAMEAIDHALEELRTALDYNESH